MAVKQNATVTQETQVDNSQLISATDRRGVFTYVNDAFCHASGYSRDELIGGDDKLLRHPDMPASVVKDLWHWVPKGYSWRGMIKYKTKAGQDYWVDSFVTPLYDQGEIVGYQGVSALPMADLTQRAERVYDAANRGSRWVMFEYSRWHKFLLLALITLIAQAFIFYHGGLLSSVITALAAMTPIVVFWQDIVPLAQRAKRMQGSFDSISRYIYHGKGTASVFDFNLGMLKVKIRAILERVQDVTIPLAEVANEVKEGITITRDSIERQRDQVLKVGASMQRMTSASNEITQDSASAADYISSTQAQCGDAQDKITKTASQIRRLAGEVETAAASADRLSEEAEKVGGLMENIQSIADQTNLLALNAAIEAARAGEYGRGFAVVADEVRSLSSRTQDTAKEVNESLTNMLNTIAQWADSMKQNKVEAESCVKAAELSDRAMEKVYREIEHIASLASHIAAAAEEQGAVSQEINDNVISIGAASEQSWQQTDKSFEQLAQLNHCVTDIVNLTDTFMPGKK